MNHLIFDFPSREALREKLEVLDALADVRTHLVGEDHALERNGGALSPGRSSTRVKSTRPSEPARSSKSGSGILAHPSSWAVMTLTPVAVSPLVIARGTWTSM